MEKTRLEQLMSKGVIFIEDGTNCKHIVGRASDGAKVYFADYLEGDASGKMGETQARNSAERYLATHQTPDTW